MPARPKLEPDVTDNPGKFDEAIRSFQERLPMTKDEFDSLVEAEKEFAFTVANVAQADVVEFVYNEIEKSLAQGGSFEEFKDAVQATLEEAWGKPDAGTIETIFRTNLNTAFNAGKYEVYTSPAIKKSRPYWRWEGIDDEAEDEDCAELNEVILPADDPFWDNCIPPLHFNCRCTITALSEDEVEDEDIDEEAPDVEADEGFGAAPSKEGSDWEPSTDYDAPGLGDALSDKLDEE